MVQDGEIPTSASDFEVLASRLLESDSALVDLATQPDQLCTFELFGASVTQPRSALLAQAIHHAETHRTQIAGILANHELDVINLDELSLWYYIGAKN
jgi:uncharacterized damage-inducible protein DinB